MNEVETMHDVIIIGRGPAGISAALYTARANVNTLMIGRSDGALRKAEKIENYFGFSGVVSGQHLLDESEKQIRRLDVQIIDEDVIGIQNEGEHFIVTTSAGEYHSKALLLATGQKQQKVKIENLDKFEGMGVSYCTTCDGFFYRNLKVGVLGYKDFAIHEAEELKAFTGDITIYTNGMDMELTDGARGKLGGFKFNQKKVVKIDGVEFLQQIIFEDGSSEELDGLFIAYESASTMDFARKLGIAIEGNAIMADHGQHTNIEGVFAAGDCTGGFKQISTAVGQGAMAGKSIIDYVRSKRKEQIQSAPEET